MPINADKPHLWKADTRASVDQFNEWFMAYAPKAYRDTRGKTVEHVDAAWLRLKTSPGLPLEIIRESPAILPTLRMSTCPPLARDRLIGLADSSKNLVGFSGRGQATASTLDEPCSTNTWEESRASSPECLTWTFSHGLQSSAAQRRKSGIGPQPSWLTGCAAPWPTR